MMEDGHNGRLRERGKKDGGGVTSSHGAGSSIVGSSSRSKRKRYGSQEKQRQGQGQGRRSPAEEVEETTEDTEMGASEDDDDQPPPIIVRRSGKARAQAKFSEDGNGVDLPAVPRKARTAIGKRPAEVSMAAVAESGGGGGGGGAGAVGGPSSTPSSLSMVSLKPGKRTKPSGSKQRNHKLPKVTTPSLVSEQEVEVAEALFDLARMFTQPAAAVVESKPEPRVIHSDLKSEAKLERKISSGSGSSLPPHPSNGPAVSSSVSAAGPAAGAAVAGTVRSSSPVSASAASPMSSPPTGASFAEVTKRKRPRLRTRTDDGGSRPKTGAMTASIALSAVQVKDANQSSSQGPTAERGTVKLEGNVSVTPIVCAISNNVAETASSAPNVAVASSGVAATVTASRGGVADVSTPRTDNNGMEKKVTLLEKTITQCNGEVEAPSSNLLEKGVEGSSVREKKIGMSECSGFGTGPNTSVDVALSASVIAEETITKTELGKRTPELAADIGRQPKREIDLMVAPSNLEDASSSEKYCEGEVGDVREATEKPAVFGQVDLAIAVNVDSSRAETRQHTEESDLAEKEKAKQLKKDEAKDREQELERSRAENDRRREANIQRESARELSKQRAREMEREFTEAIKVATQKSSNTIKGENERVQKAEKAGLGPSATTSTVSVPAPPIAISSAATGRAHSAVSSKSVGVLGCTAEITKSIPGSLGYFPTPAPAAVPEVSSSTLQVPYIVPQRAAWKRCALHVYIAHFIDLQQQLKQHQSFFGGPNQGYSKSYNLNVAVGGSDAVLGGAVGSPMVGGVGAGGADVDATERGLNAAAMAAAAAASMQGAKERAHGVGVAGRKSPGGEQHGGQQAAGLSVQVGVGGLRWEGVMEWVGEVEGVEVGLSVPAPPIAISSAATGRAHSAVSSKSVGVLGCTAEITKSIPGSLGYFPTPAPAAVPEVPYIVPQRAAWKRCALHVYIAHFIDLQQQLKQHQSFFGGPNQGYSKSYNLNVAVGGSDAVLGGAVGSPMVGGVGAGGADVDATERGLNAAAMAAAAAASMQGAKERAHGVGVAGRKSPGGEQHGGQQAAGLSVQSGMMFGYPVTQNASSGGGGGGSGVGGGGGMGGAGSVGSNGGVASAAVQAQYMQAMMQQPSGYPFGQFPGHYGAVSHTGVQQAAAQFFAAGGPYFTHHMVAHGQQAGGGGGGGGVGKQQGQGGRGYGGGGSGAQGLGSQAGSHSHSHSHSHAVQQGQQGGTRAGEREGSTAGENGSSGESRMSMVRGGGGYGQGVGSAGSGLGSGSMGGGGGVDCKLMVGTGKGSKGREQQVQGGGGGQGGGSAVQRQGQGQGQGQGGGGKGGDGVSSGGHGMSMGGAMNRGASVGPGPLGLAPVAAVMAPQGHAMIQSMAESGRGHQQLSGSISLEQQQQQHHHLMQIHHSQQQYGVNQQPQMQQRSAQNPRNAVVYVEDGLGGKDGTYTSSIGRVSEREVLEDRKLHNKRSSGASSPLSRESDSSSGMQSLSAGGGGIASSRLAGSPYHPMGSVYANMASRPSGQSASMSGTAPVQSQVLAGPKSGVARLKSTGASASASPVTLHMTSQASFAECNPGSSGAVTSTAVQNAFGCQVGKPSEAGQHTQMKLNQRSTPAALPGTTPLPAVSGTDFQAVLAAAMVKSSQGQSTQRATQLGGNINAGSNSRRRTARAGSPVSSAGVPLSPMAPPSKSSGLNSAKSSSSQKSSFPASQKVVVGAASGGGKRASSISSGYPVPSILSSSLMAQSTSGKNSQQPQMHVKGQGQGQGPQQHVGYQSQGSAQGPSQLQQQFHQQQVQQQQQHMMLLQKHPMLHQHIFHHQHLHQQQQPSHIQGSQGVAHQLQESPQATPHQQQPGSGPQTYKPSSQHLQQAQQMQPPQQQFAGGGGNGSLALSPGVSVGAGSNSSEGGGGRSSTNADAGGGGPNGRSCESAKQGGGGSVGMVNAGGQRNGGYVQQYGGGGGVSSGEQQSGSGGSGGPSGYNEGKSKSGAAGRGEEI
ncbi:uncharacterized protein [Physcomitrium patens]|uniref:uncharacterized protein n=1 Tax=Physcomitrium patens TaxID=3218 RepID=UPI003CCDB9A3